MDNNDILVHALTIGHISKLNAISRPLVELITSLKLNQKYATMAFDICVMFAELERLSHVLRKQALKMISDGRDKGFISDDEYLVRVGQLNSMIHLYEERLKEGEDAESQLLDLARSLTEAASE